MNPDRRPSKLWWHKGVNAYGNVPVINIQSVEGLKSLLCLRKYEKFDDGICGSHSPLGGFINCAANKLFIYECLRSWIIRFRSTQAHELDRNCSLKNIPQIHIRKLIA